MIFPIFDLGSRRYAHAGKKGSLILVRIGDQSKVMVVTIEHDVGCKFIEVIFASFPFLRTFYLSYWKLSLLLSLYYAKVGIQFFFFFYKSNKTISYFLLKLLHWNNQPGQFHDFLSVDLVELVGLPKCIITHSHLQIKIYKSHIILEKRIQNQLDA